MTRPARGARRSEARTIGYRFGFTADIKFNESAMDAILARAKAAGIITDYDTGRGRVLWFDGAPGARLRGVRDTVLALLPPGTKSEART